MSLGELVFPPKVKNCLPSHFGYILIDWFLLWIDSSVSVNNTLKHATGLWKWTFCLCNLFTSALQEQWQRIIVSVENLRDWESKRAFPKLKTENCLYWLKMQWKGTPYENLKPKKKYREYFIIVRMNLLSWNPLSRCSFHVYGGNS